jgi:hypothetical protein
MFAVVAVVILVLGILDILTFQLAVLWALLFIALGIVFGSWPFGGLPWRRT